MLQQARDAAQAESERLQAEAREAAEAAKAARARALLRDAQRLRGELTQRVQVQVLEISRRVLGDLAAADLEQQACRVFIERLAALDSDARAALGAALEATTEREPARLRSAFELPAAQRTALQTALDASFGRPIPLSFETAPGLVSGIELSAPGQKLAWSISDYLGALSSSLEDRLRVTEPA